ncbi:MAG: methyltransferase domain-containing protein [Roseiflexaceae bacterium]|nr:methyltransferase domain-containing protein [Roseiflexaceae bacterium]
MEAKNRVQQQFGAAAERYVASQSHAKGNDLRRMVELAQLRGNERMLDIATGGGHTALAFAPHVREVVASDLTAPMLAAAERFIRSQGAQNVSFELADAEELPFAEASFDLVTVRIAPHHFPDPARFVGEVARVLRPGGQFIFNDNVVPEDAELAGFINRVEQWRDPSHVRSLPASEWLVLLTAAGLQAEHVESGLPKPFEFAPWAERMSMAQDERAALEAWMIAAPQHVREAFDLHVENERVISFRGDFALIVARRL